MIFKMKCFVRLYTLFCVSGIISVLAEENHSCKTPKNAPGQCMDIVSCKSLLSIVQNRPINSTNADYLMKSRCGTSNGSRKVCCPDSTAETVSRNGSPNSYETPVPVSSPLLPNHQVCGIDSPSKIYGGEKTDIREFPWMVLIENRGKNCSTICGGVIINNRYVLTAAHCFKGKYLSISCNITTVRLGEYNLDTDPDCVEEIRGCAPPVRIIPAEEKIVHEDYNPYDFNRYNDIALVRLSEEINYSAYIQPICLPTTAYDHAINFTGTKLTVAGFGQTEDSKASHSSEKRKVNLPVRENSYCSSLYRESSIFLNGAQMCVGGDKGKDSCKGDSGGPLMDMYADQNGTVNWYSIGIVSYGPTPCGSEDWPGVYVKVANYVSWIVSKLRS